MTNRTVTLNIVQGLLILNKYIDSNPTMGVNALDDEIRFGPINPKLVTDVDKAELESIGWQAPTTIESVWRYYL